MNGISKPSKLSSVIALSKKLCVQSLVLVAQIVTYALLNISGICVIWLLLSPLSSCMMQKESIQKYCRAKLFCYVDRIDDSGW